jgi:subtilisin family serine protease
MHARLLAAMSVLACLALPSIASATPIIVQLDDASDGRAVARSVGAQSVQVSAQLDLAVIDVPNARAALAALRKDGRVESASADAHVSVDATANDTLLGSQWHLSTLSSLASWDIGRGTGATVAVVDTGVDSTHPDLAGQILSGGYDYVDDDSVPQDGAGHGTHVAGTIAAVANNSIGVAGVAPGAKILPVRVLDNTGNGWMSDVALGIVYATDHGADVINLSLGGASGSFAVEDALTYARANDVLVYCASGNENTAFLSYPAAYSTCEAVGATNQSDARASFSNYGTGLDIVAPGVDIMSTVPGGYTTSSGTSMATPMASAVAAQLIGMGLGDDATLATLRATAQDLGTAGYDTQFGYGRIDALGAAQSAQTQLAAILKVNSYSAPAARQLTVTGQAFTGWRTMTVRAAGSTVRVYSTRANAPGVSVSTSAGQITVTGLAGIGGRQILTVTVDGSALSLGGVYMPMDAVMVSSTGPGQLTVTGSGLDMVTWIRVRDSLGIWHSYANPRSVNSGDAKASLWTATTFMVTDPALIGRQIVRVEAVAYGTTVLGQDISVST